MKFNQGAFIEAASVLNYNQVFTNFCDTIVLNSYDPKFIASNMERYLESTFSPCIDQAMSMLQGEECSGTVILNNKVYDANVISSQISQALSQGDEIPHITLNDGTVMSVLDIADQIKDQISSTAAAIAAYGSIAAGSSIDYLTTKARSLSIGDDWTNSQYINAYSSIIAGDGSDLTKIAAISQMLQSTQVSGEPDGSLLVHIDEKFGCGSPLSLSSFRQAFSNVADVVAGALVIFGGIISKIVGLSILIVKIIIQAVKGYTEDVDDWYLMNEQATYKKFCYYPIIQQRCLPSRLRSKSNVLIPETSEDESIKAYIEFIQSVVDEKRSYCELHNDYHVFLWVDDDGYLNLQVFGNTECSTSGITCFLSKDRLPSYPFYSYFMVGKHDDLNSLRQYGVHSSDAMPSNNSDYIRAYGIGCALSQFATDNCFYGYALDSRRGHMINTICSLINYWKGLERTEDDIYFEGFDLDESDFDWLARSLLFTGYAEGNVDFMLPGVQLGLDARQCLSRTTLLPNCGPFSVLYQNFDYPTLDAETLSLMFDLRPKLDYGVIINTIMEKWFMLSEIDFMKFLPYSSNLSNRSYGYGLRSQEYYDKIGDIAASTIIAITATIAAASAITYTKVRLNKKANLENAQVGAAASQVYQAKMQFGSNSTQYRQAVSNYNSQVSKAKWYNFLTGNGYSYSGALLASNIGSSDVDLTPVIKLIK